jgi:hypothetical protein
MTQVNDVEKNQVYLVTGVVIAIDEGDGILIAGMLSDSPLTAEDNGVNTDQKFGRQFCIYQAKSQIFKRPSQ